jgi:hypothetical protein
MVSFYVKIPEITNDSDVLVAHEHTGNSELLKRRIEVLNVQLLLLLDVLDKFFTRFIFLFGRLLF